MTKYIYIEADINDGDYISEMKQITDEELETIKPVIEAVRKNQNRYENLDMSDKYDAEECYGHLEGFKTFNQFVPTGEYGIHTIERIIIYNVESLEELL